MTSRVAWTEDNDKSSVEASIGGGTTEKEEDFDVLDHGWDRYQYLQKQWWATDVNWEPNVG